MSPEDVDINLNSLALVREELEATLQRAASEFEAYLLDHNNAGALQNCQDDIAQVAGTLRLIQFTGAALLADEMAAAIADVAGAAPPAAEAIAAALSHAFFALPRYIEFVAARHFAQPLLILPVVNELRVARRQPLVPEYQFERRPLPTSPSAPLPVAGAGAGREALARSRQMFQIGLLAILKQQNEALNLQLLARAGARFALQAPAGSGDGIWHLAAAATAALAEGGLALNINRRRTLGAIERLMARYIKGGEAALAETEADRQLRRELVFMLALSAHREGFAQKVIAAFGIPRLTPDDRELSAQREAMRGPGIEAIDSVVKVLKEELRGAKDILEIGAQNQGISTEELAPLRETLGRVADTLRMVNLRAPGDMLRGQLEVVQGWAGSTGDVPVEQFLGVADALLFIESSLSSLYRNELTTADLEQVSDAMRRQIVADSQLAEAAGLVIDEAQAGIALAKRAITAYVESGFDLIHIANVAVTLNGVRGGLQILEHRRAAAILKNCAVFIDGYVHDKQHNSPQRHQLLETLADALISMEYYLTELAAGRKPDDKILAVAEESLAALGFAAVEG